MSQERFKELFAKWHSKELTEAEKLEFSGLYQTVNVEEVLTPELHLLWSEITPDSLVSDDEIHKSINSILQQYPGEKADNNLRVVHRVHFLKTAWFRAAVAVLLFVGVGTYLWLKPATNEPSIANTESVPAKNDVAPGGNKAILKLADGSEIILNDAANGKLADDGGAIIQKSADGEITYSASQQRATEVVFNSMSTPRGGQYQLVLPDGSKVWLNAESSITFPTRFTGAQREVKLSGEGYFEVAKNAKQPFIVKTNGTKIEVLGTAFNVNSYTDEKTMKTSLVEGSIKVENKILKPGQAYSKGKIIATDINQDIAWKNGKFNFTGVTIQEAMRQIARWYDVEIVYEKELPEMRLYGGMQRNLSLSQVLKGLSVMNINYRIEGKKLILLP